MTFFGDIQWRERGLQQFSRATRAEENGLLTETEHFTKPTLYITVKNKSPTNDSTPEAAVFSPAVTWSTV